MRALTLALALSLAVPSAGLAAPAISCHCFRDREFDPARPTAADPYLLATARNSLLAAAFGVDKGEVVRSLMTGTSPDDLWVAHWAAAKTGGDAAKLLEAKAGKGTWKAALAGSEKRLGAAFAGPLAAGASDPVLSAVAVDDVLVRRLGADARSLLALRARGASTPAVILCTLLSSRARRPAVDLLADVASGRESWGTLVTGLRVEPKGIEGEIRGSLR
jgi:hypothetical protein